MSNSAKAAIIDHALDAFVHGPYSRVSLREIAARSGYSHTYVHQLFGNKQAIFAEALHEAQNRMERQAAILPTDLPQVIMLKVLGTNPLNQPIVKLLRKAAGDPEMLEAFKDLWSSHKHPIVTHLTKLIDFKNTRFRFEGNQIDMSAVSFFVWGLAVIFTPFIVEMLSTMLQNDEDTTFSNDLQPLFNAAPQELLLNFIHVLGGATK